jgi:ATP-dependent DNA helicase PIF1
MNLSEEQLLALKEYSEGKNIFLTGPGGSGKSELIRRMVSASQTKGKQVQVCALTGCASVLLNCKAKTIHSWSGIGLASGFSDSIVKKVYQNKFKSSGWKKIDILIIDEVSMMSVKVFDILDSIGKCVRKQQDKPFGGIQVVFSGDFYQLPPVGNKEDPETMEFCFESKLWKSTFQSIIQLKTIFRQTDVDYTKILNQIRIGKLYKSGFELLTKQVGKPFPLTDEATGILFKPTILLPRRKDADLINIRELNKLSGDSIIYKLKQATDLVISEKDKKNMIEVNSSDKDFELKYLENNIIADSELILKKGAQVMCITNMDMDGVEQIVNGSQGVVIDFVGGLPLVKFNNGPTRTIGHHVWLSEKIPGLGVKQIPLIHAWAITIHKAQGVSLDMAQIDAGSNIFECGQTYVALSRVKSLSGLYLTAFDPLKIKVNKKVQEFYLTIK